jgi:hypothetical protein
VQVVNLDVEVLEQITQADVWIVRAYDASLLSHGLCIDDPDDRSITAQIHSECALNAIKLVLGSMTDEDNGLERSVSANAMAHERVDDDLLRLSYRDEFGGTEMEDFRVYSTWDVVEKVGVWHT